jgi:hypothetical protein
MGWCWRSAPTNYSYHYSAIRLRIGSKASAGTKRWAGESVGIQAKAGFFNTLEGFWHRHTESQRRPSLLKKTGQVAYVSANEAKRPSPAGSTVSKEASS